MRELKITIEKQKSWNEEDLKIKHTLGVEAFTLTDLPFSSVLQAYWFLYIFLLNLLVFSLLKFFNTRISTWWEDSDGYVFYNSLMKNKKNTDILSVFWKLHTRLLQHESVLNAVSYTPKSIPTIAVNGRTKIQVQRRITQILGHINISNVYGIFVVSGGGVLQKYFVKKIPYLFFWLGKTSEAVTILRSQTPVKIICASNPNLDRETVDLLATKSPDEIFTQPPFIFLKFVEYIKKINDDQRTKHVLVRVGIPVFTSAWNVRFWMMLTDINWRKEREANELVRLFEQEWSKDTTKEKKYFKKFSINWTLELIKKVDAISPNVRGIHLMTMGNFISAEEILLRLQINDFKIEDDLIFESIKYKNHFREVISTRCLEDGGREFLINLHKVSLPKIEEFNRGEECIFLEEKYVSQSKSLLWKFNLEFWNNLESYMKALSRDYKKTIGGSPDSNDRLAKYCVSTCLEFLNETSEKQNYLEIGAAGTQWASLFLKELEKFGLSEKINYIFIDYSQKVLDKAREELGLSYAGASIEYICVAEEKYQLEFERKHMQNIFRIHTTNVYDNFPYGRFLLKDGKYYEVLTKLFISKVSLEKLIEKFSYSGLLAEDLYREVSNLRQTKDVKYFLEYFKEKLKDSFYLFWQELWNELKFEEFCVACNMEEFNGFFQKNNLKRLEFSVSEEVVSDVLDKLNLLSQNGMFEIVDIFAKDISEYKNFLGPVKYDASVANYINLVELEIAIKEKRPEIIFQLQSMSNFGGRPNQYLLEIKNS